MEIKDIVAVNECIFQKNQEHAIFFTFKGEVTGGNIPINNPEKISEIKCIDISNADKLMHYQKSGIAKLINGNF